MPLTLKNFYKQWWQPWANTIWYYTMDNDILNHATTWSTFPDGVLNTATFSTAKKHWINTYSLYCDGSTYAYLPASSAFVFWTNDFTLACWVYAESNSNKHPWIISNYWATKWDSAASRTVNWYRLASRMSGVDWGSFSSVVGSWGNWLNMNTNISMNGWRHCLILTRTSWVYKVYVDWVLWASDSSYTTVGCWRNNDIQFWLNRADNQYTECYLNDVIWENVWWSAQDVQDYYNLTNI